MRKLSAIAAATLLPATAFAHPGHIDHGSPLIQGLSHPVSGADHLLAMLAIGLLAAQMGGRAILALPVSFVGAMIAGGLLAGGNPLAGVEPMILASVVILGVLVAMAMRLPMVALVPMVAVFGAAHGWAHGAEGPAQGAALYAAGFAAATMGLHLLGIALGRAARSALALRMLGGATSVAGLALVMAG
ncbi:HupE/UreJ family protein [Paracoccus indicus]|uniref:HupE/UreJ family protein n=1 Tax=Paracoccus indicus TaxID=2079229 RepID=UPI000D343215|nr:HupE/UreJ family protein [Paracoccus indicus]